MKLKLSAILTVVLLILSLTACGKKDENLLENKGPDHIIPPEYYDNPNIDLKHDSSDSAAMLNTEHIKISDSHLIKMENILQEPELPTGCEITSLAIVLNHLGYSISKTTLASDYLEKDYTGKVGFDKAFIGDPTWEDGYGCFAPVIVNAANKYLNKQNMKHCAWDISGTEFADLFAYIDRDIPVIVWASMGLMEVYKNPCFTDTAGNQVYWYDNEHCVVLCGYSLTENTVTASDPLSGTVEYSIDRFKYIYDKLEKQAVIID